MLKPMARGFLNVLVALSLLIAVAKPSMSMDNSSIQTISNAMDCPACVPLTHSAGSSVCVELPCFNLAEAAQVVSPTAIHRIVYAM